MSKLTNKETKIKSSETEFANYGLLIIQCLNVTPKEGFTVSEMSKRIDLIKYIQSVETNKPLDIKAEDLMYIKKLYENMQWGVMHEDIINLWNDLSEL
jgi:hypothetical protein